MAVTVEDLIQLAFPRGSTVVAGRSGLQREVVWARSLRPRPPAFEPLEGGELALVSTSQLSLIEESMSLSYLITRLAQVDVAAVAVVGEVSEEDAEAADRLGMPLIQLPPGSSLPEVERSAIATVVDRQAELQRKASEVHRQLAQLTFEERGLQAVADRLAQITGKSVAIEDEQCRLQYGAAAAGQPDPEDLELSASRRSVERWASTVAMSGANPPVGKFPVAGSPFSRLVAPIPARDGLAGYLSLIGLEEQLTELDRMSAGRGAAVCAVEVAKDAAVGEAKARVRGDLLDQLLSGGIESDQMAMGRARRLGYDPTLPSVVIVFRVGDPAGHASSTSLGPLDRMRRQLESLLRAEMSARDRRSLVAARGGLVVAVLPVQAAPTGRAVQDLAEDLQRRAQAALEGFTVAAGIGRPTSGGASLAVSFREAEGALGVGVRVHGPASATYFGDLGILRLLAQIGNQHELESFKEEMLGRLEERDRRGGELLKTLEVLFHCHGNLTRTAEQLSLHRNSLLYRMERIGEISGLNLDDPETRLSLQVALKIRQLLEAENGQA